MFTLVGENTEAPHLDSLTQQNAGQQAPTIWAKRQSCIVVICDHAVQQW